jgi:hypothetical protein
MAYLDFSHSTENMVVTDDVVVNKTNIVDSSGKLDIVIDVDNQPKMKPNTKASKTTSANRPFPHGKKLTLPSP